MSRARTGRRSSTLLAAAAASGALFAVGCGGGDDAGEFEYYAPVRIDEVRSGTVEDVVEATGTLRAAAEATLSTEQVGVLRVAPGRDGVRLRDGDRVEAGQVVAVIEGEDPRVAARLDAAQARYEQTLAEYESQKRLHEEGIVDAMSVKAAQSAMVGARLDLEQAQLTEAKTVIRSPIDGVLVDMARNADGTPIASGQRVQSGFQVTRVIDVGTLVAELDIAGGEIGRVRVGQPARVSHYALDETFTGEVWRIGPTIDRVTRTFRVEVELPRPGGALRPGMFVRARIVTDRREDVPVVPRHAVVTRGGDSVVFTVEGQQAVMHRVVTGLGDDESVEVREGIELGARLVTSGYETLVDGSRVRVTSG